MDNDEYFNSYIACVTSSRAIIRSAMSLLERQDDMLRLMYLNWSDPYEAEPTPPPLSPPTPTPAPLRRRTGLGTHSPVYRAAVRNSAQSPLNTRFYRENLRRQQNSPPVRPRNLDNNNQPSDNNIANIFAQAILNSIGNMSPLSPVVVRPSQRTIELATENILFSEIPASIDRYQQCPISHDSFQPDTPITRIRRCGHYFERESIATWFQTSCRCPICRTDIREGITDDAAHNEEVVDESDDPDDDNTNNESRNSAEENTSNVERNRSIADILSAISSAGETSDFPGATISYQLEFVPVVQNMSSPTTGPTSGPTTRATSATTRQRYASSMNRNSHPTGHHRTTFSRHDPSGNNFF